MTRDHVDTPAQAIDLLSVFRRRERRVALRLNVAQPATVEVFNPADATVKVTLAFRPVVHDTGEALGPLSVSGLPVCYPAGGGCSDTFPLQPGDQGFVLVMDRDTSIWLQRGGSSAPEDPRAHSMADAVFVPLLQHQRGPIDPTARVIDGPLVKLGSSASEAVLKGTTLAATVTTLQTVLSATPPAAGDPASNAVAANANKAAIQGLFSALQNALSTKVFTE